MMSPKKPTITVIVCGVGCDEQIIDPYCKAIALYCLDQMKAGKKIRIVTTGGYTDPENFPGIAAAKLMRTLLNVYALHLLTIKAEDLSWTLSENLEQSELVLRRWMSRDGYHPDQISVFCDLAQTVSAKLMSNILIGTIHQSPIEVIGYDFGHSRAEISILMAQAVVEQNYLLNRRAEIEETGEWFQELRLIR